MIQPGFEGVSSIWQPENQRAIFRCLLDAMSYPGRRFDLGAHIGGAQPELALLAALTDETVTYSDPNSILAESGRVMLSASYAPTESADFLLFDAALAPLKSLSPRQGTLYRPDESATLILRCGSLAHGDLTLAFQGPGIRDRERLHVDGLHHAWPERRAEWCANFPLGVDIFLCDDRCVAGLPRTSRVVIEGGR